MITQTSKPGGLMLDATGFVSTACVTRAAAIVPHLSLYVGGRYGVSKAHWQALWDAGGAGSPNWERMANQALQGYQDGRNSVDSARTTEDGWQLDWSKIPTIFSGVDYSAPTTDWPQLDLWHQGIVDRSLEVGFVGGAYGQTAYMQHLYAQSWWPAQFPIWVWGGSGDFPGSTVKQWYGYPSGNDYSGVGCTVDESTFHGSLTLWAGDGQPVTIGDDMRWFFANQENYPAFTDPDGTSWRGPNADGSWPPSYIVWEIVPGGKRHLSGAEWFALCNYNGNDRQGWPGSAIALGPQWQPTGWIQSMPDVKPAAVQAPTVDLSPVITAVANVGNAVKTVDTKVSAGRPIDLTGNMRPLG